MTINKKLRKTLLIVIGALLVFTLTITYAYFGGIVGDGANTNVDILSGNVTSLTFTKGTDINLRINPNTLTEGGSNVSDETTATATLALGDEVASASDSYQVYFMIPNNTHIYTTVDKKAEIILSVTGPDGNPVTLPGLPSVTVTDAVTGETITGYDATTKQGYMKIAEDYAISGTTTQVHEWTAKLTFVNLDTNQALNGGKVFEGDLILQKEKIPEPADIFIKASNTYYQGPNNQINCEAATATWNSKYNSIRISALKPETECELVKTAGTSTTNLNDYITSLVGTVQGTGEVVSENGIRYEGKNPNNYVWFNEDLWRVIGVFDTVLADGTTTETLTKIIRADSIGGLAWDSGNSNEWEDATLNLLLNTSYLNAENGTGTVNCKGYSTTISANCDYTIKGIQNEYQNMIADVTWNIGGYSSAGTANTLYSAESLKTSTGKIGLMNLSDYGYSVLSSSCVRTTNLSDYDSNSCAGNSWVYKEGFELTISEYSSYSYYVWGLSSGGYASSYSARYGYAVRPVLNLESNVKYLEGTGSIADPFIVELG